MAIDTGAALLRANETVLTTDTLIGFAPGSPNVPLRIPLSVALYGLGLGNSATRDVGVTGGVALYDATQAALDVSTLPMSVVIAGNFTFSATQLRARLLLLSGSPSAGAVATFPNSPFCTQVKNTTNVLIVIARTGGATPYNLQPDETQTFFFAV